MGDFCEKSHGNFPPKDIFSYLSPPLAIKYMSGEERGGILLNVQSEEEEQGREGREGREDLRELQESGVKVVTIIRPSGEYHDSEQIHITDDQHSPYSSFNK